MARALTGRRTGTISPETLSTPEAPLIGKTLAHYEIVALLGKGGMGEGYRARDTKLKRDIALKVLPADMADDPARLERFEREAKTVAGIVKLHSVEEADGVRFLTMASPTSHSGRRPPSSS